MADNLKIVPIPSNTWVDLYAETGITVGTVLNVENSGSSDVYLAVQAAQPANDDKKYNVIKRPPSVNMQNSEGDLGAWAYSGNQGGQLSISSPLKEGFTPVVRSNLNDGFGNPLSSYYDIETDSYVLNVHGADVHNQIINKYIHQHTATVTTLSTAVPGDGSTYIIDVADATGFVVGDYIHVDTTTLETTHPIIISSTAATGPATFELDRRLDGPHEIGDEVRLSVINMSTQIGTLAAPQEYFVGPQPGEVWHLTRILFEMEHETAGDMGKFGGIAALINGVVVRAKVNSQYGTLTNWKTNGNIKTDMFDVVFDARAGGQGSFGTSGRGTFTETGSVLRLDGNTVDRLELYIQDDLTDLISFTMKAQGHFEGF